MFPISTSHGARWETMSGTLPRRYPDRAAHPLVPDDDQVVAVLGGHLADLLAWLRRKEVAGDVRVAELGRRLGEDRGTHRLVPHVHDLEGRAHAPAELAAEGEA